MLGVEGGGQGLGYKQRGDERQGLYIEALQRRAQQGQQQDWQTQEGQQQGWQGQQGQQQECAGQQGQPEVVGSRTLSLFLRCL